MMDPNDFLLGWESMVPKDISLGRDSSMDYGTFRTLWLFLSFFGFKAVFDLLYLLIADYGLFYRGNDRFLSRLIASFDMFWFRDNYYFLYLIPDLIIVVSSSACYLVGNLDKYSRICLSLHRSLYKLFINLTIKMDKKICDCFYMYGM